MQVTLPGGLSRNGNLHRLATFLPLTGKIEQTLIETETGANRPEHVSWLLGSVLDRIGDQTADFDCVSNLCVADRQYLMLRLAALLDGEQMWLKLRCAHCEEYFDVEVRRCDLPMKPAARDFPRVEFRLGELAIVARIPTGADQQTICTLADDEAMTCLLRRCVDSVDGAKPTEDFFSRLSAADIDVIDDALDEAAPAVCDRLVVKCPECEQQQYAALDHYALDCVDRYAFYDEVHTLASHYHWSERAILDLQQSKRHLYINLINRTGRIPDARQMA